MAEIVKLHPSIVLTDGVLTSKGLAWGGNALQTVTIVRRTPVNPQQAIGYKGTVDYTSGVVTSDVTLDCILTENCVAASALTSVYKHAETEVDIEQESYVLTSCNLTFQAGNPATVNYGYITAGEAKALRATADPEVLLAGEEAAFAVVMGEDGTGVKIVAFTSAKAAFVIPAGAQNVGFNSSLNRNQILDVRSSSPVQFVTTYPLDITMSLEILQSLGKILPDGSSGAEKAADKLNALEIRAGASTLAQGLLTTPIGHAEGRVDGNPDGVTQPADVEVPSADIATEGKLYVRASGLKKTEENESINVGGNLTFTYSFNASDLQIPLEVGGETGGGSTGGGSTSETP